MPDNTISDNLNRLVQAKSDIADAITDKGGTVSEGDGFEAFSSDIRSIPSGSSYTAMTDEDIDSVDYYSMSTTSMVVSPQVLAYLISYVSGNMLGDPLPNNANLNNYAGFDYEFRSYYRNDNSTTVTNIPSGVTAGFKLLCSHLKSNQFYQIVIPDDSTRPRFYIRQTGDNLTWSDWAEIGDNVYTTTISGLNFPSTNVSSTGRDYTIDITNYKNGVAYGVQDVATGVLPYGNSSKGGVVRLKDVASTSYDSTNGWAATPKCVANAVAGITPHTYTSEISIGSASEQSGGSINYTFTISNDEDSTHLIDEDSTATLTIPVASTSAYGVTKLSSSTSSTSTSLAATPSAVKAAYDLANSANTAATTTATTSVYGVTKLSSSTSSTSTTLAATPSAVRSAYNLADSAYDLADSLQSSIPTHENFLVTIGNLSWSQLNGSTGWFYADISDHTYTEIYAVTLGINEKCNKNYILMPAITGTSSNTKVRLFCNADSSSLTTWKQRIHVCGIL